HLALWHGFTPAPAMSAIALAGGLLLMWRHGTVNRLRLAVPRPEAMRLFQASIAGMVRLSRWFLRRLDNASLPSYLGVIVASIGGLAITGYLIAGGAPPAAARALLPVNVPAVTGWILLRLACGLMIMLHHDRLAALIVTSIVGLV